MLSCTLHRLRESNADSETDVETETATATTAQWDPETKAEPVVEEELATFGEIDHDQLLRMYRAETAETADAADAAEAAEADDVDPAADPDAADALPAMSAEAATTVQRPHGPGASSHEEHATTPVLGPAAAAAEQPVASAQVDGAAADLDVETHLAFLLSVPVLVLGALFL